MFSKLFGLLVLGVVSLSCMAIQPQSAFAQGGRTRLEARFVGVKAKARYENRDSRHKFNFQLELATPGATGSVSVTTAGGTFNLGTFTVDAAGRGIIDIDTTEGDAVPAMALNDAVTLTYNGNTYTASFRGR